MGVFSKTDFLSFAALTQGCGKRCGSCDGVYCDIWERIFSLENIEDVFHEKVRNRSGPGVDRITAARFEKELTSQAQIISRKCIAGTYKFTPFLEELILKGRGVSPRVISIATVRDKIVLSLIKEYMHIIFSSFVARDLPNTIVYKVKRNIKDQMAAEVIRLDLKGFYDSIDHETLINKIVTVNKYKPFLRLLRCAIGTPTLPANYSVSLRKSSKNKIGVPQGLPISNILAEIYMAEFDKAIAVECCLYNRFVDDILILSSKKSCRRIWNVVNHNLNQLSLKLNKEKSTKNGQVNRLNEGIEFLGYSFSKQGVSVKRKSYDKFINSILGKITKYKSGIPDKKEVFINELNERITGAIDERKRYGWIFFYSEINDLGLLYQIDRIIGEAVRRIKGFTSNDCRKVKKVVRSYFEARYSPEGGYIHNYNLYLTEQDKRQYLISIGRLTDPDALYTDKEINTWFNQAKSHNLLKLERDVGRFS